MTKVAYFLDIFPVITETFILHEIIELRKRGLGVVVFSRQTPDFYPYNPLVHSESKNLIKETLYIFPVYRLVGKLNKILIHLITLLINPLSYLRTFAFVLQYQKNLFQEFKLAPFYIREIKKQKITHIHAHFARESSDAAMVVSMITGLPFSFSVHAWDLYDRDSKEINTHMLFSAFMVTCTDYNRKMLLEKYGKLAKEKIFLNYHGVDVEKFKPWQRTSQDRKSILSVGRLVEKKGFLYLIEALALLSHYYPLMPRVTIIGDGPQRSLLVKLVEHFGLADCVSFTGSLSMEQVRKYYQKADIFVLSSVIASNGDRDGIPNVILEAMAMELAVVSTTVSGIAEVISDGVDGLLVSQRDSQALADAIDKLIKDENLRQTLAKKGREKVISCFNKAVWIDELYRLICSD